jgi:manganese oxidase
VGGLIEVGGIEVNAIDALLYVWFVLAGLSTAYVVWDQFVKKNPEETVMKWGWVLITLYMGPVALALYVMADKEPEAGSHEEFIRPLWKQGVASILYQPLSPLALLAAYAGEASSPRRG